MSRPSVGVASRPQLMLSPIGFRRGNLTSARLNLLLLVTVGSLVVLSQSNNFGSAASSPTASPSAANSSDRPTPGERQLVEYKNWVPVGRPALSEHEVQPKAAGDDTFADDSPALVQAERQFDEQQQQQVHFGAYEDDAAPPEALKSLHRQLIVPASKYQHQQQPVSNRRLGLLKAKQHYMGQPSPPSLMASANYVAASSFLNDCERCLASLGAANQPTVATSQFAELQQEPPVVVSQPAPAPAPAAIPVVPISPAPSAVIPMQVGQMQPHYGSFGMPSLKSKLFMKFPFFLKAGHQGGGGGPNPGANYMQPAAYSYYNSDQHFSSHQQQQQPAPVDFAWHLLVPPSPPPQPGRLILRPSNGYNCLHGLQPSLPISSASAALAGPAPSQEIISIQQQQQQLGKTSSPGHQFSKQQTAYPSPAYAKRAK